LMKIAELEMLVALRRARSLRAAAAELRTVQSNLSMRLRRLEQRLGTQLFDRATRRLTPVGEQMAEEAERILANVRALESLAGTARGKPVVRVGITELCSRWMAPLLVDKLAPQRQSVRLVIVEGSSEDLAGQLGAGFLDFAVVTEREFPKELVFFPVFEDPLYLCIPKEQYRRANPEPGRPVSLPPLLIPASPLGYSVPVNELLSRLRTGKQRADAVIAEVSSISLLAEMAFRLRHPTILPRSALTPSLADSFELVALADLPKRTVGILCHARRQLSHQGSLALDVAFRLAEAMASYTQKRHQKLARSPAPSKEPALRA
jgi:DNA-binding transcriptional LysR family regulator